MAKVIIGIHGLENKPPCAVLQLWWKQAIREGLDRIGCPWYFLPLRLTYWADVVYPRALDPALESEDDPLFVAEPYRPGADVPDRPPHRFGQKTLRFIERILDKIWLHSDLSLRFGRVSDMLLRRYFRDLSNYYNHPAGTAGNGEPALAQKIQVRLAEMLHRHRRKRIMLVAHSMGSIIAYDTLTLLTPDIEIDTLVTMGSPLGLPVVMSKIASARPPELQHQTTLTTPENVTGRWINFADLSDHIALNYNLSDDYGPNSRGVSPVDVQVRNDYTSNGRANSHKSFGYLRAPEFARSVDHFLRVDQSGARQFLTGTLNRMFAGTQTGDANATK